MDKLVLGVVTLALSAGAASAQALYPGYGYAPYGYGYATYGYRYAAGAPLYDYAAPAYGYAATPPLYNYAAPTYAAPATTSRPFASPWSVEEESACFVVRDHNGQARANVYFEDESARRSAAQPRL